MNIYDDYYLDLNYISETCKIKAEGEGEKEPIHTLDVFKYEIIKMCLEKIMFPDEEKDDNDKLLMKKSEDPAFNLAFNTLEHSKIIKKL